MLNKLAKLLDAKSIVTLTLTGVFAYSTVIGKVMPDQFLTIFTVVISFYFGTQAQKKTEDRSNG